MTPGYRTAEIDGDFVVFLIGMRINRPWKLHKWIPVTFAMGPMLRELSRRKELGLLGFTTWISPTGPLVVQYWRTVEQLEAFAKDARLPHHPAWKRFNQAVAGRGDVGIWHESYQVRDGAYESVYVNMPVTGLAAAGRSVAVTSRNRSAAARRAENAVVS